MTDRLTTADGHLVGVGDRVWTAHHLPWVIRRIGPTNGDPRWAFMDRDPAYAAQPDLGPAHFLAAQDVPLSVHEFHPANSSCDWAGCRHRPRGAR